MAVRRKKRKLNSGRPKLEMVKITLTQAEAHQLYERGVKLIQQNPAYYYSFCGNKIFRDYHLMHKIFRDEAELLVIFSYHKYFLQKDLKLWGYHHKNGTLVLNRMIGKGYIVKEKAPVVNNIISRRNVLVPTEKGKAFVEGYKAYYDARMEQIFVADAANTKSVRNTGIKEKASKLEEKVQKELWHKRVLKKKMVFDPKNPEKGCWQAPTMTRFI